MDAQEKCGGGCRGDQELSRKARDSTYYKLGKACQDDSVQVIVGDRAANLTHHRGV